MTGIIADTPKNKELSLEKPVKKVEIIGKEHRKTQSNPEDRMSVAKVIELISEGASVENAIENAAAQAAKTLKNVRSVYAEGIQGIVKDGKVTSYRVNCKVTFVVD